MIIAYNTFESPKEKQLARELDQLKLQYDLLNKRIDQSFMVLDDLQKRDDNIYRVIFEAEPIPTGVRRAGYGGTDRYAQLQGYDNSELMVRATQKLDFLSKQIVVQSKSYDEILKLVQNKANMLGAIPAIQPVSTKDLKQMASGFGWRTDPIYKMPKFHAGMDFAAPIGTEVYATGDGVVQRADAQASGYGNHIRVDHGYGYMTLYGHLSRTKVRPGQKVKRGEVIGYVGNTGKSTGPHLHYEVMKNGEHQNPINYYFNDLTPDEYEAMLKISANSNQSFD
ncbi:MAG: M23 family metallopeptidase [Sphingobacteriales bacterium JAD_PAG50586_3]|nr:MAG: M23 family metallopeptidase [Sphingobacteriales bacterium JAD_PAG50586_3]